MADPEQPDDVDVQGQPRLIRTFHGPTVGWRNVSGAELDLPAGGGDGDGTFLLLPDTPNSYVGQAGKVVNVNAGETGLEFGTTAAPASTFLGLSDTPDTYVGHIGKAVTVNPGGTGLEFTTIAVGPSGPDVTPDWVNVRDFGAIGDGVSRKLTAVFGSNAEAQVVYPFIDDYTSNVELDWCGIQKAIDFAFANRIRKIYIPSGTYTTHCPIFLDAPNNLRGTFALWNAATNYVTGNKVKWNGVPWQASSNSGPPGTKPGTNDLDWLPTYKNGASTVPFYDFSLALIGDGGTAVGTPSTHVRGTVIEPKAQNFPAIWSGTGQHMMVSEIIIGGPSTQNPSLSQGGAGIAIAGGSAGASHTVIHACVVMGGYYRGFVTGLNSDSLADSNIFERCEARYCYKGYDIFQTQNYINALIDCRATFCNKSVVSNVSKAIQIRGGNFSFAGAASGNFNISSINATNDGGQNLGVFVTIVLTGGPHNDINSGKINTFAVNTAHFGPVPLIKTGWNPGTLTWTGQVSYPYMRELKRDVGNPTGEFESELEAATTLYGVEGVTVMEGSGFHVNGLHVENPFTVTTFYGDISGFAGDQSNSFDNVIFNWDPTLYEVLASGFLNIYLCQTTTPFVRMADGRTRAVFTNCGISGLLELHIHASVTGGTGTPSSVVRVLGDTAGGGQIQNQITDGYNTWQSPARGGGKTTGGWGCYYRPFEPNRDLSFDDNFYRRGSGDHWGFRPAPYTTPRITSTVVELLASSPLPALVLNGSDSQQNRGAPYPILHGDTLYNVGEWNQDVQGQSVLAVRSRHKFYSYGQDLPITWEYRARSTTIHVSNISLMFPGLGIIINNGVSGDVEYVVLAVYRGYTGTVFPTRPGGYITVCRALDNKDNGTAGTGGTVYSSTSPGATSNIKQAPYRLTFITGEFRATKTSTYTVKIWDCGTQFDNTGAVSGFVFTLPVITAAVVGLRYGFYVGAAQTLQVAAPASTTIRIAGSTTTVAGFINSNVVGNYIELEAVSTTLWVAKSVVGTWVLA